MNEPTDPTPKSSDTDGSQRPYKPLSPIWRLLLLGAPSLALLGFVALVSVASLASRYVPDSALQSILMLWALITVPIGLLGPLFGAFDLVKSLNPTRSRTPSLDSFYGSGS
jgi:hypothetical protein